ncbi:MAG: alpha/beta hydrolase [Bifidobacteriaceae bacterium]|jgi:predicted alpha/beta hydrolase family esterase|nr:alpha/beta hydrolase [Bifidobacteriaceae bacterium]
MRVFIVHGYSASRHDHWFGWLAGELDRRGHGSVIIDLPNPESPHRDAWEGAVAAAVGRVDQDMALVAHSLGGITALRYLAGLVGPWRLGGLVMVAGFQGKLRALPELDGYLAEPVDVRGLNPRIGSAAMIHSDNDPLVPPRQSRALAAALGASTLEVAGRGHFLASDGCTELPEVLALTLGL